MLIPVVQSWSKRNKLNERKLLMPLSYSSILGGTCTLIGTSTNLIVYGFAKIDQPDLKLNLFEIGKVGIILVIIGIIYVMIFHRLLKGEGKVSPTEENMILLKNKEYILSFTLSSNRYVNKSLEENGLWNFGEIKIHSIESEGKNKKN